MRAESRGQEANGFVTVVLFENLPRRASKTYSGRQTHGSSISLRLKSPDNLLNSVDSSPEDVHFAYILVASRHETCISRRSVSTCPLSGLPSSSLGDLMSMSPSWISLAKLPQLETSLPTAGRAALPVDVAAPERAVFDTPHLLHLYTLSAGALRQSLDQRFDLLLHHPMLAEALLIGVPEQEESN